MAARIRNKLQPRVPNIPRRGQTAVMGEINRSIEKMSLGEAGSSGVKGLTESKARGVMMGGNMRRDSSWTVSTEGYGSMRSNTSASRRCSELSQVGPGQRPAHCQALNHNISLSQMSTMSPWDPISPGSSRRSSEAGAGARMSPVVSQHLSKLHKKALAAGTNSSLAQVMRRTINYYSAPQFGTISGCESKE